MTDTLKTLEAAALTAQQAAGRAWADLCAPGSDESQELWEQLNANYEAAKAEQDRTYEAWKAAKASA